MKDSLIGVIFCSQDWRGSLVIVCCQIKSHSELRMPNGEAYEERDTTQQPICWLKSKPGSVFFIYLTWTSLNIRINLIY